jgi:catechol 2,3-dioxygenase-like lactoylglutathione lyase family enzyme
VAGSYDSTIEAIDHLDLVVTSLERSLAFYTGLLEPLGYVRRSEIVGERGERVVYIGRHGFAGSVSLRQSQSNAHQTPYDRYAVGIHHIAFAASSRALVDQLAAWAREHGAEIESEPREYDYTPGYYAAFLHDPDGLKLEIVNRPTERDLAWRVHELADRVAALERRGP